MQKPQSTAATIRTTFTTPVSVSTSTSTNWAENGGELIGATCEAVADLMHLAVQRMQGGPPAHIEDRLPGRSSGPPPPSSVRSSGPRLQQFARGFQDLPPHVLRCLLGRHAGHVRGAGGIGADVERRPVRVARIDDDLVHFDAEGFRDHLPKDRVRPGPQVRFPRQDVAGAVIVQLDRRGTPIDSGDPVALHGAGHADAAPDLPAVFGGAPRGPPQPNASAPRRMASVRPSSKILRPAFFPSERTTEIGSSWFSLMQAFCGETPGDPCPACSAISSI